MTRSGKRRFILKDKLHVAELYRAQTLPGLTNTHRMANARKRAEKAAPKKSHRLLQRARNQNSPVTS